MYEVYVKHFYYLKKGEVKMENKFKPGDLVFEVVPNRKIRLVSLTSNNVKLYPVRSDDDSYTNEGYMFTLLEAGTPSLFHATPENRQALVTLYGEDAVPKIPLRGSELTKKLLEKQKYVICYVSDTSDDDARAKETAMAIGSYNGFFWLSNKHNEWRYAVPIDMNGNEITENYYD